MNGNCPRTFRWGGERMVYGLAVGAGLAVACAVLVFGASERVLPAGRLWLLAAMSGLLWPTLRRPPLASLQAVVGLFLCYLPIGAAMGRRVVVGALGGGLSLSVGTAVLVLFMAAYFVARLGRAKAEPADIKDVAGPAAAWAVGYGVLLLHVLLLAVLLHEIYGYGYDKSATAFARMGLFLLTWLALRSTWRTTEVRRLVSVLMIVTYALAAIVTGGMVQP